MARMLITGVSGMLGGNLAYHFRDTYEVLGLYCAHAVAIDGVRTQKGDILSGGPFNKTVEEFSPDVVIHCASLTDVDFCETHKELTRKVNVLGTRAVADAIAGANTSLIYISSDSVYDGSKDNFLETDPIRPMNYYGLSKYEGELETLKRSHSLVLRTNIFGWNVQDKFSIAEWIVHDLSAGTQVNGFRDAYFSSIYTMELAEIMTLALRQGLRGVYNCGSRTSMSKHDFAVHLAERMALDTSLIRPISIEDFGFVAKRGYDLTLDVSRISAALHRDLPTIDECIDAFARDFEAGVPGEIKGWQRPREAGPRRKVLSYSRQSIDDDDIAAVVETLKSDWLTQGPGIGDFESALCDYTGAKYAVSVSSGTAALHIACLAAGVGPQHEAIVSPMTFAASSNCVLYCGGRPVFADVQKDTANIDPEEIKKAVTDKTRAIIPVHYAGNPCSLAEIRQIAERRGLIVIEDAAHALGAEYEGTKIGSCEYSDMAIFSFHPVKSITAGEGGAVLTNSEQFYEKLVMLRNHGITKDPATFAALDSRDAPPWYYEMQHLGFNYRMSNIHAALGMSQLRKLDRFIARRREIAQRYSDEFSGIDGIELPREAKSARAAWHLYQMRLADSPGVEREQRRMFDYLLTNGIRPQVHYIPVHFHPYYQQKLRCRRGDYPVAESHYRRALSLPIYPGLSDQDVQTVLTVVKEYFNE